MRRILTILLTLAGSLCISAAPIDEARRLFNEGQYEQALEKLTAIVKKSPRDGNANYWLGATYMALDREHEARTYFITAEDRGVADAALALARLDIAAYDPEGASGHFDTYERLMRKNKRTINEDLEAERSRLVTMENMLARVERVAVIDSLVVDAEEFFKHYRISPEAGRLINGATARLPEVEYVFMPQNNTEIIYAQPDSAGNYRLMGADILDDGSLEHPAPLRGDDLAGGGNAEYPFMLTDGLTLYYANDGEGSLGGYDIFLTRRDEDGEFLQPQNIGMPYNSPDDDYLLAIDEITGAGWWASDRNHIPGMVTIYVFVPSETRVNVDADDPDLTSLARLSSIAMTREPGKDYSSLLKRIASIDTTVPMAQQDAQTSAFTLPIGSTSRIYHNLSDFGSAQARQLMARAIDARAGIMKLESQLENLRRIYAGGDRSVANRILVLEDQLDDARGQYSALVNKAIAAELKK